MYPILERPIAVSPDRGYLQAHRLVRSEALSATAGGAPFFWD